MSSTTWNFGRPRPSVSVADLFKNDALEEHVRSHLVKVYTTLAIVLSVATVGCMAHIFYRIGGNLTILAGFLCLIYLAVDSQASHTKRLGVASAFGFFQGASMGPLLDYALYINPSLIVTALMGTATVFICFSASAIFARRQQMLFMGGLLGSALSCLFVMGLANLFIRSAFMHTAYLYIALFVFSGYVLYDTQIIMERVRLGDKNYIQHAIELFIDFVGIFKTLLVILMEKEQNNKKRNR